MFKYFKCEINDQTVKYDGTTLKVFFIAIDTQYSTSSKYVRSINFLRNYIYTLQIIHIILKIKYFLV